MAAAAATDKYYAAIFKTQNLIYIDMYLERINVLHIADIKRMYEVDQVKLPPPY